MPDFLFFFLKVRCHDRAVRDTARDAPLRSANCKFFHPTEIPLNLMKPDEGEMLRDSSLKMMCLKELLTLREINNVSTIGSRGLLTLRVSQHCPHHVLLTAFAPELDQKAHRIRTCAVHIQHKPLCTCLTVCPMCVCFFCSRVLLGSSPTEVRREKRAAGCDTRCDPMKEFVKVRPKSDVKRRQQF